VAVELPLLIQRHETQLPALQIFLSKLLCVLCWFMHMQLDLMTALIDGSEMLCKRCCAEIPTLVFLTKIDKYDPDVIGEDLSKTFHSVRLLSLMEVSACLHHLAVDLCIRLQCAARPH